ncbi:Asp-tRNA(Asn)/Glu-tRNA(Gln) amidotransferase GatCAB subunit A [Candidatus Jorgensenbacteria bacterium CG23_combo_of_CG06-09_8_20_14_all_54_14]|uniref:Glutamyl-tRNA(Gln) amidotransferase subunit A n=1 Tax=Candidatus Jorgensenbacteria bacterium CG23_combo_of_CG06-09_8_20_14_all_54_14 TaxID=1974595 RepID=A0A2G9ZBF1_9BACT|nr:MAG: Asp-tRNA(Asn)/Glu-tRNA(Gln) amidotransferase GatCAB subunit A [Candidatus Jorgensenbacteria bacterium CG23_combo_of_CG06-09_8_20_14_all_54_14]
MELKTLTIAGVRQGLLEKRFSAAELTEEFLGWAEVHDRDIGAFLSLDREGALAKAKAVDEMIATGAQLPPLAGIPIALKDNILVEGIKTTAASKILENYVASYDATVVAKLKEAGAIIIGKTNLDEFAMGSSTENSAFGVTKNPYDITRVAGGSSGGSAAAVAAGMAVAALGSDTSGSICLPAAFCGVVGLRPTYGSVSRSGLIAMASSLDQIGPLTKTVADARILFESIRGEDPLDATSVPGKSFKTLSPDEVRALRIGIPKEYFTAGLDGAVTRGMETVIEKLKWLGLVMKPISLPHTRYALSVYYIIMPAEVSANLARFDGIRYGRTHNPQPTTHNLQDVYFKTRGEGFGAEVRRRILLGTYVLSAGYYDAYYAKAQKVRALIARDFDEAFKSVDVILAPVTPTPAFKIGEKILDPLAMYLSDVFTTQTNLAGIPALSMPVDGYRAERKELPVGFQLIGKRFRDDEVLAVGEFYERAV